MYDISKLSKLQVLVKDGIYSYIKLSQFLVFSMPQSRYFLKVPV